MVENPFIVKGYESADFFCDRDAETAEIIANIQNGRDTTLISPRKYGKTGLILHVFEMAKKKRLKIDTLYVDIYATLSLDDLTKTLAESMLRAFPERTSVGKMFLSVLKGLRPTLTYDSISGAPQLQFNYGSVAEKEYTLKSLFEFLNSRDKGVVLAFDEFQQISEYPEKNVEALLRTYTQSMRNIRFIFCGSKKRLMAEMFTSAGRPFFSSTSLLTLGKIDGEKYAEFIKQHFSNVGRSIDDESVAWILHWTRRHTFYTQSLCNEVFAQGVNVTLPIVKAAAQDILSRESSYFLQYRELLTRQQWLTLIAIAKEGKVSKITSAAFLQKYGIGSITNVRRAVESLQEKELLLASDTKEKKEYRVYDVFLSHWLEQEF
ncbi:AAA family ATPase [Fibrobacter sp.]|uniref:AAA family ATPase n=1 Tax=Fibrobacter sp. TaxID=35828 RepID=UPI0038902F7C